ncbi:MAG: FtsB/FtsL family cell division protein, partial [Sulfuricella sp.]
MRWLTLIFVVLIAALQYPLWLGKGSWLRVWEVDRAATQQKEINQKLRAR